MLTRENAIEYVSFVVDDAGSGREIYSDRYAIVREKDKNSDGLNYEYPSVLVGWQCGFEPLFVAVHSYLDVELDDDEVVEMATDYLNERKWFVNENETPEPDYIIR